LGRRHSARATALRRTWLRRTIAGWVSTLGQASQFTPVAAARHHRGQGWRTQ
jgi:hypothetical protein